MLTNYLFNAQIQESILIYISIYGGNKLYDLMIIFSLNFIATATDLIHRMQLIRIFQKSIFFFSSWHWIELILKYNSHWHSFISARKIIIISWANSQVSIDKQKFGWPFIGEKEIDWIACCMLVQRNNFIISLARCIFILLPPLRVGCEQCVSPGPVKW